MFEIENLTEKQKEAIEELRRRIEHEFTPRMREDESILYRFLKARDFNLRDAEILLRKHLRDREIFKVDTILTDYEPPQLMKEYIPHGFVGLDKEGNLVRYIELAASDHKGIVHMWSLRQLVMNDFFTMEQDFQRYKEQSEKLGAPFPRYCLIFNMEGLTFAKVTYKKALESFLKEFQHFQDNYPERVNSVYVINVSFYFNIGFSIVKSCIASGFLQKMRVYGKDGWKEDLLKIIDADVLPAFLGGNRTDPDGNPLCNTFITHAKSIPEELYNKKLKNLLSKENNVKQLTVTRFSSSEIMFHVYEPNSYLEWEFETKIRDIGFALYYKDNSIHDTKTVELIPKQRIDTRFGSETGVYKCEKVGTYIIVFDNSYSWIHSKEIFYRICVKKPNEIESHFSATSNMVTSN